MKRISTSLILTILVALLCICVAILVFILQKPQSKATRIQRLPDVSIQPEATSQTIVPSVSSSASDKVLIADFYWWYPWDGMQYPNPNGIGMLPPHTDSSGNTSQDAFAYQFTNPIPYLISSERQQGSQNQSAALDWIKGNFSRAGSAGIDVLAVMTRPDLKEWIPALKLMIEAQRELKVEAKPYPKLMFHFDGVEYWDKQSPSTGQLTGQGTHYEAIWNGVKDTFDTLALAISKDNPSDHLFFQPGTTDTIPFFVYRIEGNAHDFVTSNWWTTQLKSDFAARYTQKMYLILDDYWCNKTYGGNNSITTQTCNGDNQYHWGAALEGTKDVSQGNALKILTVGPGFDNHSIAGANAKSRPRQNGSFYSTNLQKAESLGANWILIETFNFGEEGTAIDQTTGPNSFGSQYLDITKAFSSQWKGLKK